MRRMLATLLAPLLLVGCGAAVHVKATPNRGGPPLPPAPAVRSDDDFTVRRGEFEALGLDSPSRPGARAALEAWAVAEARRDLDAGRPDGALEALRQVAAMWDVAELRSASPIEDAALSQLAEAVEKVYRRRGAHRAVLLALAVERTLHPTDAAAQLRWNQVRDWMLGPGSGRGTDGREKLIADLEAVVEVWPSPPVVDELARLLIESADSLERGGPGPSGMREMLSRNRYRDTRLPQRLVALYLRVSRPDQARAALDKVDGDGRALLIGLLDRHLAKEATFADALELAKRFKDQYPVAERICRDATRRFPRDPDPWLCLDSLAQIHKKSPVAVRAAEEALQRDPTRYDTWQELAILYRQRLAVLASDDKIGDLDGELKRLEAFYQRAQVRFPSKPLRPSMAPALYVVGRGYFNVGKINEAIQLLERSVAIEPTVPALEQLGLVALKRGHGPAAIAFFQRATAAVGSEDPAKRYYRARLLTALADALDLTGATVEAEQARRDASTDWEMLLRQRPNMGRDEVAEAELERGKILYQLGQREAAISSLQRAIDVKPDNGATYAQVLSFLIPRGERDEALDAYHRALGRSEVSEYLKVYLTLWVLGLDRRVGLPEDRLARTFLAGVDGGKWYHELARWATGRQTERELEAHADTTRKRVEADFYRAMRRLERGDRAEARVLWKRVLDTEMMADFEYDMASYYLRSGKF